MTVPIWQQIRNHVEADAEHQRLSAAHRDIIREENAKTAAIRSGTYTLQRLLLARDAVLHFAGKMECTDSDQDEQLEELTANHGECWAGMFNAAAEDVTESILDLCDVLHSQRLERSALRQQREEAYAAMRACADRLEEEYKKAHAGTTGPEA
jgi:predicted nuclease with TOPRIM domain